MYLEKAERAQKPHLDLRARSLTASTRSSTQSHAGAAQSSASTAPMLVASISAFVTLAYTPGVHPPPLSCSHRRVASSPVLQLPNIGKMGSDFMGKLGFNPGDNMGMSDEEMGSMEERLRQGQMTFDDFLKQVSVMQKGASVQAMLGKMGGSGMSDEQLQEGQKKLVRYGEYIKFMEEDERADPQLLIQEMQAVRAGGQPERLKRLADAAEVRVEDVGQFVLEFDMMRGGASAATVRCHSGARTDAAAASHTAIAPPSPLARALLTLFRARPMCLLTPFVRCAAVACAAAVKFSNGEDPESIKRSMMEQQQQQGPKMNRQQRRMAAKKTKKKAKASGGFGR